MNPPIGVYQVGERSPDGRYVVAKDTRIQQWLTERDIDYSTVYRMRLFSLGAWVFRFAVNDAGKFFTNSILNEPEHRLPLWVWQ